MLKQVNLPKTYTPEQVAEILQLSKNTIYELIARGEIVAKKIGRVYRIPRASISFVFTGLDEDIYQMQKEDEKNLEKAKGVIRKVRKQLWQKSKSF
jgi:excisionase family DNA binding protein